MTIYTLYVKVHRKTKFRYLGQTKQDPYVYSGSGKDWLTHLKEHGNDTDTIILLQTSSTEERNYWGRYYSRLWNIVTAVDDFGNKIWANKIPETGGGAGSYRLDPNKAALASAKQSATIKKRRSGKAYKQSGSDNNMYGKRGLLHHGYGKPRPDTTRQLISENHYNVAGANNPKARHVTITTPGGVVHQCYGNLSEVCTELGLSINTVYIMLSIGRQQFTRGKFKGTCVFYSS